MSRGRTQLIIKGAERKSDMIPSSFYLQNFSGSNPDRFDFTMRVSEQSRIPQTGDSVLLQINGIPEFRGFVRERQVKRIGRDYLVPITCADNTVRIAQTVINWTYLKRSIRDIITNANDGLFSARASQQDELDFFSLRDIILDPTISITGGLAKVLTRQFNREPLDVILDELATELDFIWRLFPNNQFVFTPRDIGLRTGNDARRIKAWFTDERPLGAKNEQGFTGFTSAYSEFSLLESIANTINYVNVQGGKETIIPAADNAQYFRQLGVRTADGVQKAFDLRYRWDRPPVEEGEKEKSTIDVVVNTGDDVAPAWDAAKERLAWNNENPQNVTSVLEPGTGPNDVIWSPSGGSLIFITAPPAKINSFLINGVIIENIQSAVRAPDLERRVGYRAALNVRDAGIRTRTQAQERAEGILQSAAPRQVAMFRTDTNVEPTDVIRITNSEGIGGNSPFSVNANFTVDLVKTFYSHSEGDVDVYTHQIQAYDTNRVTTEALDSRGTRT